VKLQRMATSFGSRAVYIDSRQTDICAYLCAILLGGLLLNALLGWWWADPVATLCILPLIFDEGIEEAIMLQRANYLNEFMQQRNSEKIRNMVDSRLIPFATIRREP
jgi:divalent metal cation (Fe/Co/Zn/Cd) transporter